MTPRDDQTDAETERAQDDANDTEWTVIEQAHYDRSSDRDLITAIIFAIAAAKDVDPTEVKAPPLYECVDIAAIEDGFFGPTVAGESRDSEARSHSATTAIELRSQATAGLPCSNPAHVANPDEHCDFRRKHRVRRPHWTV